MSDQPDLAAPDEASWGGGNYFNYFTEIEEHFQRARGTGLFLLSPLDWALIENWKNAGIPLEAVLKGIDQSFEKWHSRKQKRRQINSVAYCTQAVLETAQRAPRTSRSPVSEAPFTAAELQKHLSTAAASLRSRPAASLDELAGAPESLLGNLEDLERRLTALEEKIVAALRTLESEDVLYSIRLSLDAELTPYRGKMTADQLAMLERRYLDTALLEHAKLPRLSLFYIHPV
jgi:hypothetical protein